MLLRPPGMLIFSHFSWLLFWPLRFCLSIRTHAWLPGPAELRGTSFHSALYNAVQVTELSLWVSCRALAPWGQWCIRATLGPKAHGKLVPVSLYFLISLHVMSPCLSSTHCHKGLSICLWRTVSFSLHYCLKASIIYPNETEPAKISSVIWSDNNL